MPWCRARFPDATDQHEDASMKAIEKVVRFSETENQAFVDFLRQKLNARIDNTPLAPCMSVVDRMAALLAWMTG